MDVPGVHDVVTFSLLVSARVMVDTLGRVSCESKY